MSKLSRDWFNRRAEDAYTFADDSKRFFSWDRGRDSYSSFFVRNNDSLKVAAKMIGSIFRVIGVPKDFEYTNNAEANSRNPLVQIPLSMLRDEKGNYLDKDTELLDAFYGASIQNAALATMQTTSEYYQTMKARDTSKDVGLKDLLFTVLNTERIDKKLADRLPGYLKFVQKFKNHRYENAPVVGKEEPAQKRLMDLIVKMLRYPANISESDLEEFEKPVTGIERLLKKYGGIPNTTAECASMATSLANIIVKYTEDEEPPPPGEGEGDDEEDGGSSSGKSKPKLSKSDLDEMAKEMIKSLINAEEGNKEGGFIKEFEDFTEDMIPGTHHIPNSKDYDEEGFAEDSIVVFLKADTNISAYKNALHKVDGTKAAVLQKLFARKSKDHAFVMKSMRSGRLDTNKIAEAVQNVPTIYERMGRVTTNKICVGVLIDESGSMGGSKIDKARQAAIFINEVFKNMPDVDLYMYGHTADTPSTHLTYLRVYREKGYVTDPFSLGSIEARGNNRDGDAILAFAKRVRKNTPNQGLLFVLSDGQPSAVGYSGRSAIEDTKSKVQKAQALGFQVLQIAIEESVPSAQMFDYFIKMTDIKNLPNDMINYMSRKVDKLIKERVTL